MPKHNKKPAAGTASPASPWSRRSRPFGAINNKARAAAASDSEDTDDDSFLLNSKRTFAKKSPPQPPPQGEVPIAGVRQLVPKQPIKYKYLDVHKEDNNNKDEDDAGLGLAVDEATASKKSPSSSVFGSSLSTSSTTAATAGGSSSSFAAIATTTAAYDKLPPLVVEFLMYAGIKSAEEFMTTPCTEMSGSFLQWRTLQGLGPTIEGENGAVHLLNHLKTDYRKAHSSARKTSTGARSLVTPGTTTTTGTRLSSPPSVGEASSSRLGPARRTSPRRRSSKKRPSSTNSTSDDDEDDDRYPFYKLWSRLKGKGWQFKNGCYVRPASMRPEKDWIQGIDYFCTQQEVVAFVQARDAALDGLDGQVKKTMTNQKKMKDATGGTSSIIIPSFSSTYMSNQKKKKEATEGTSTIIIPSFSSTYMSNQKKKKNATGGTSTTITPSCSSTYGRHPNTKKNDPETRMDEVIDLLSDEDTDPAANRKLPPTIHWTCPRCTVVNKNAVSICPVCRYNPIEDEDEDGVASPRQQPAKRKNTYGSIAATSKSSDRIGKRVKRESDLLRQGNLKDATGNDDDDVIVSAVVESQQQRRRDRRRSNTSTSTDTSSTNKRSGIASATTTAAEDDADDDVVLEAVVNEMKLPHNRADCTECNFVNTLYNKYNASIYCSDALNPDSWEDNIECCDMCYCYVCDVPTKDCKQWSSISSALPADNHCCAKPNTEPWQSMRNTQKQLREQEQATVDARAAIVAATAAARLAGDSSNTLAIGPQQAPFGRHFQKDCKHNQCASCWCYVCSGTWGMCEHKSFHRNADPTIKEWQIQRQLFLNASLLLVLPTRGKAGPFSPDDTQAVDDSLLDKTLIQCQHCNWYMRRNTREDNPASAYYYDRYAKSKLNKMPDKYDWCLKCGLVASESDLEKIQADPIAKEVVKPRKNDGTDNGIATDIPMANIKQQQQPRPQLVYAKPYLLGTKEIPFTIKPHDPRKMEKYNKNWKDLAEDCGWKYNQSKQKEEVFLHRIGKKPKLEHILKNSSEVASMFIPTDQPPPGTDWDRSCGTAATLDDTDAIIIKNQTHLQLLKLLKELDASQGIADIDASWNSTTNSGVFTVNLYLPQSAFIESRETLVCPREHGGYSAIFMQPAVISLWFGIAFNAGQLCGSLNLSPAPKVTPPKFCGRDYKVLLVKSKTHEMKIDSSLLKKSEEKLKRGQKQIEMDKKNTSSQEQTQSLVSSDSGRQRYLYHGGGVPTNTSLSHNLTRYFREMFPQLVDSQDTTKMLTIHHGQSQSNHNDRHSNDYILDALIGVKEAVVARTGFSKDAADFRSYKSRFLGSQEQVAKTIASLESLGHASEEHVDGLKVSLLPFQKQALKWAIERETMPDGIQSFYWPKVSDDPQLYYNPMLHKFRKDKPAIVRGGFLAQEMGLGKTVISLALILKNPAPNFPPTGSGVQMLELDTPNNVVAASTVDNTATSSIVPAGDNNPKGVGWNKDTYKKTSSTNKKRGSIICGGTLVICPVSLVGQWIEEAKQKLSDPGLVYPYHGNHRKRDPNILSKNSIVVTTYNVLASDAFYHSAKGGVNYCPPLEMIRWWRVICDEGHCLKTNNTNLSKATSQIVADHKWIVSGTPMNTKIFDVQNQMQFLGIENVRQMFNISSMLGSSGRNKTGVVPEHISYMLKPILLRHAQNQKYAGTDTTLMSLPPKTERTINIEFDDDEIKEYDVIEKKAQQFYLNFRASHSTTMSSHFLKVSQKLTPLRVACSGGKYPLENETQQDDSDEEKKPSPKVYSDFAFTSKFRVLLKELESIRDTDASSKSLVFSQFNSTLAYLQDELPKHGFQFRTLQGSMTMKQRSKALSDFQNDPPTTVFLLSMRSGAVGINLTQANRIFLMEPSFNPALEAQAIGRVHRLGQKREVNIARLVVSNCFESRMMKFLQNKYHAHENATPTSSPDGATATSTATVPAEEETKTNHEDGNEMGGGGGAGIVGNLFREKAEVVMEEFDQLFGVPSLVDERQAKAEADAANAADGLVPDFIGSHALNNNHSAQPDHVGSRHI